MSFHYLTLRITTMYNRAHFYFELASCPQTLQKYDTPSLPNLELHQCFEQFSCHLTPCNKNIIEKDISTMQPSHVNTAIFAPGLK